MESKTNKRRYSEIDLDEAYINGLECAVAVLEQAIKLSYNGRRLMLESLRKLVHEHKVRAVIDRM